MKTIKTPVPLTEAEIAAVSGGDLGLPNGKTMFEGFDNAAPFAGHPSFAVGGQDGPWNAAFNSPAIQFKG